MNLNEKDKIEIFENAISWVVVLAMITYGAGKIVQFEDAVDFNKVISDMTGMELMWAFYSYSKPFVYTLGAIEVIGGILILIKKTRLIGCLFTIPILLTIILQDIFFGVHLGALKAAIIYLFLILIILWINREKITQSLRILLQLNREKLPKSKIFFKLIISFSVFVLLRILEYYVTIKW